VEQRAQSSSLGAVMRAWRSRRRLSQLDLALAADMSQRHISFVESGRTNPSRAAVHRLCDALEVPAIDRERIYLAAGYAILRPDAAWEASVRQAVAESLAFIIERHEPYPAMVVDRLWNLKSANAAAARFIARVGGRPELNVVKALLDPDCLRSALVNWRDAAARLMGLIELEVARRLSDPEGERLLHELMALPGLGDLPARTQEAVGPALILHFRVADTELRLFSMVASIGMTADPALEDLKLETLLPADEQTRAWFAN
jgi:transcriptional regulator with XRE-family HTH domain